MRHVEITTFALLLAASLAPRAAAAHELERTQVVLTFAADGSFVLDVSNDPAWLLLRLESFAGVMRADALDADARNRRLRELAPVFVDRVVLFVDAHEIRPTSAEYIAPRHQGASDPLPPLATFRLRGRMPADAKILRWLYGLVMDPYPLTIRRTDGAARIEWIQGSNWSGLIDLTGQFRRASRVTVARDYLALGYRHILPEGVDHILFVIGLFLLSAHVRPLLLQVTAFTVAHSITLALSVYGLVALPARIVEPLIALSIAYVAVENLVTSKLQPWRLALVFAFGLLHGLGFAGVLADLGLPRADFAIALVSFNAGVEAGQLTVLATAALFVWWSRHRAWYHQRVVVPVSLTIAVVGVYWTLTRALG